MSELDELTAPEQDVLIALTEGMSITTVVKLASDLYNRGNDRRFDGGDIVGFVMLVLEGLNEKGLVQYRVPTGRNDHTTEHAWSGLPLSIRLTPKGWAVCGYPRFNTEVGSRNASRREVRPGDRTEYRTHKQHAEGGEIEVMQWWQHRHVYPTHIHNYELFTEDTMSDSRTYLKVTPELEERVVHAYARHGNYTDTAREVNLTPRQVKYALTKHNDAVSLKERTLSVIREKGPFPTLVSLYAELPGAHGMHNFVHILHSLHKSGLIDFTEDNSSGGRGNYLNIRARTNGSAPEVRDIQVSQPEPVVTPTPVVVTTPKSTYPELERLFGLAVEALNGKRKATQWLAAAELLSETDPETSDLLLQRAAQAETTVLAPVESEYLRYVEDHPDTDDNPAG